MIAVDTNAIAYLWIPGDNTALAEKVLQKDREWATSSLWRSEFRNVLANYMRRGELTVDEACECMERAAAQLAGYEYKVPSRPVMQLVACSKCTAYDCEFVTVAEDLGVPLVTSDKLILQEFPDVAISLTDFPRRLRSSS